ncbi:SNF2 helicase-associated domain-containing protein [Streptomyces sp. YIM S03343]
MTDDEAFDLLGDATDALRAAGVDVHWPRELVKALTATAEIGQRTAPGSTAGGLLDTEALLDFRWQVSLGDEPLTEAEMDALAESRRPLVRLRDQWVLADPKLVARAKRRRMEPLTPMEALSAALTGEVERDGDRVPCAAVGALGDLVARIRDPESRTPVPQPAALNATLREYQKRGLAWLAATPSPCRTATASTSTKATGCRWSARPGPCCPGTTVSNSAAATAGTPTASGIQGWAIS